MERAFSRPVVPRQLILPRAALFRVRKRAARRQPSKKTPTTNKRQKSKKRPPATKRPVHAGTRSEGEERRVAVEGTKRGRRKGEARRRGGVGRCSSAVAGTCAHRLLVTRKKGSYPATKERRRRRRGSARTGKWRQCAANRQPGRASGPAALSSCFHAFIHHVVLRSRVNPLPRTIDFLLRG